MADLQDYVPEPIRSFIFNAPTAADAAPMSPQSLENRRKMALAMMARRRSAYPKNLGEGLTSFGEGIADAAELRSLDQKERAYDAAINKAVSGVPVPGATPATPGTPATPAPPAPTAALDDEVNAGRNQMAAMMIPNFIGASDEPASTPETAPAVDEGASVPLPPPRPVYDRSRQIAELQDNPQLVSRLASMVQGEGSDPRVMTETVLNRAAARGTPLARELETFSGPGSRGYYPPQTFQRGQPQDFQANILAPVLRGSDVGGQALGFSPTGNASGGVAARGVASGRYNNAGRLPGDRETFVQQESPMQLARLEQTRVPANAADAISVALGQPRAGAYAPDQTLAADNPPIVRPDITPAPPVQMAQARTPAPAAGSPLSTTPSPKDIQEPAAPRLDTRPTPEEIRAMELARRFPGDPTVGVVVEQLMKYGAAQRQADFEQRKAQFEQRRDIYKNEFENRYAREASERVRGLATSMGLTNEEAAAVSKDFIEKKRPAAQTIAEGQDAIRQARAALMAGAITGIGSEARINWSRVMSLLGRPDAGSDAANAQAFGILMQPVTNAQRAAAVGNTQISNADIVMSKMASGADVSLEPKAIFHVLNVLEDNGLKHLQDYKTRSETLFGTDKHPGRAAVYGAPAFESEPQMFPAPPNGRPVQVWTERDLQRFPRGTRVILPSGREGVVQ